MSHILGIDIGGTNTVFGLIDPNGKVHGKNKIPTQGSEPAEIWVHHDDIAGRESGIGTDQMEEGIAEGLYLPGCAVAGVDLDRTIPSGCSECGGRRHGWWTVGVLVDGGLETFKQCGISCPGCEGDPFHDRHVGQEVGCWGRRSTPGLRQRVSARARPRR